MKTILYLLISLLLVTFTAVPSRAQNYQLRYDIDPQQNINARFRLFKTLNPFTFLELDTRTGCISQAQFSVSKAPIGSVWINGKSLLESGDTARDGRFTLYPTENAYNFILIDQDSGNLWQCQWSFESKSRCLIPIEHSIQKESVSTNENSSSNPSH